MMPGIGSPPVSGGRVQCLEISSILKAGYYYMTGFFLFDCLSTSSVQPCPARPDARSLTLEE